MTEQKKRVVELTDAQAKALSWCIDRVTKHGSLVEVFDDLPAEEMAELHRINRGMRLTSFELQVLEECAGLRRPGEWGRDHDAAVEHLSSQGMMAGPAFASDEGRAVVGLQRSVNMKGQEKRVHDEACAYAMAARLAEEHPDALVHGRHVMRGGRWEFEHLGIAIPARCYAERAPCTCGARETRIVFQETPKAGRLEMERDEARDFAEAYRDRAVQYSPEHNCVLPWEDGYDPERHEPRQEEPPDSWPDAES